MISARDVHKIVHSFVKHTGNPRGSWESFENFAFRYAKRFSDQIPGSESLLGEERRTILRTSLKELEKGGAVTLDRDSVGEIDALYYPGFYPAEIGRWYRRMNDERSLPFPSEQEMAMTIPTNLLRTVEVENDLMHWLKDEEVDPDQILLIRYPNNVHDVLATARLLRDAMVPIVVGKIRDYLRTDKNAGYAETKLRSIFRTREMLVHDLIETAQTRPDEALKSIQKPNEFSFHFWTQLSSMIIQDYAQKTERLEMEHGFMQSAYFLGYYSVYFKGEHQRARESEEQRKLLDSGFKKAPWAFTVQDVYNFKDDKGVTLLKKAPKEDINLWITEMMKRPSESQISELVTINTPERNGVMVHAEQYVPLVLRQVKAAGPVIERDLVNQMARILLNDRDEVWLHDPDAFEQKVADSVKADFSLLHGLANFTTLFLVIDGQELPAGMRDAGMSLLDRGAKEMRRWSEIFQLDRAKMVKDAKLRLPAWMLIPVLRGIVRLFRRMFSTDSSATRHSSGERRTHARAETATRPPASKSENSREAAKKAFKATLSKMQEPYLNSGQTPDQRLKELRKQWNPLIDPGAAENLVEDVNSLCRDALRRARYARTLRAPDPAAIEEMARTIAVNSTFERIRRRKQFEIYLKLYMLTVLQRA